MYKHSWRRCIKWEKNLPNNKCHEIPCETRAVYYMASHYCNGDSLKLVIMYIFLIGKSFVKITLQNSISKRIWNIHCWAIRAPTSSHGRDRAPDSLTLSQSNVLSYRLICFFLFRYSFRLIPYNIQAFNK